MLAVLVVSPWPVCGQAPGATTNKFNEKTIKQCTLKGPLGETPKRLSIEYVRAWTLKGS